MKRRVILVTALTIAMLTGGDASAQTVKILAVGNSFSANALRFFTNIVAAAGDEVVVGHAMIGGCDFDRHVRHADAFEKNPADNAGRPYAGKKSLQDLLQQDAWQYVTIQQVSHKSPDPETFQPGAGKLIAYIRKYAPQAEIVVHQTWAYRDDYPVGGSKNFTSTDDMYRKVRRSYDAFCKANGLRLIPSGDAMQAARQDSAWGLFQPDTSFDPAKAKHPQLPQEKRSLHHGYVWRKNTGTGEFKLGWDKFHANRQGEYLQGCVWYEFFFKRDVSGNTFVPAGVTPQDAAILRRIAHRVAGEGQRPPL